jgi:hypothetical protein
MAAETTPPVIPVISIFEPHTLHTVLSATKPALKST